MKKTIRIIKNNKEKKNKIDNELWNSLDLSNNSFQINKLSRLYMNEEYRGSDTIKKEIKRKINSYKQQDKRKNRNLENMISFDDTLEKLIVSKLICHYCRRHCKLLYNVSRDESQWTLDRINNSMAHTKENVVVCCLKCNLSKRVKNEEIFKLEKQMILIKHH